MSTSVPVFCKRKHSIHYPPFKLSVLLTPYIVLLFSWSLRTIPFSGNIWERVGPNGGVKGWGQRVGPNGGNAKPPVNFSWFQVINKTFLIQCARPRLVVGSRGGETLPDLIHRPILLTVSRQCSAVTSLLLSLLRCLGRRVITTRATVGQTSRVRLQLVVIPF